MTLNAFGTASSLLRPAAIAALALVAAAPAAHAQSAAKAMVDAGKAQGTVGEQADGYLGLVGGADPSVASAVAEINAGRAQAYRDAAAKAGTSPDAAGAAASRLLFARIPPGGYFRPAGGGWTRK